MEGFPNSESTKVQISQEEFRLFHSIDRRLYLILVADLLRNPVEAMQTMALWLWLERVGFFNIIRRILELPVMLINDIADEANTCLNFIDNPLSLLTPETCEIPLTQSVIQKEFSLQYLQKNQTLAKFGVERVQNNICMRAFSDLMQDAILRNEAQRIVESQQQLLVQQTMLSNGFGNGVVPADERTMFVTFSKGYPVAEWEVREFFTKLFGDCIESFYMQEVRDMEDQALFARIVFFQANIIHIILNGVPKAKFTIGGKHVWMRKFVPKRARTMATQSSQQSHNNGLA